MAFAFAARNQVGKGIRDGSKLSSNAVKRPDFTMRPCISHPMQLKKGSHIFFSLATMMSSSSTTEQSASSNTSTLHPNDDDDDAAAAANANSVSNMSLSQLLQLLNERHVRYAPDATRTDLEQLLLHHNSKNKQSKPTSANLETAASSSSTATQYSERKSAQSSNPPISSKNSDASKRKTRITNHDRIVDAEVVGEHQQKTTLETAKGSGRSRFDSTMSEHYAVGKDAKQTKRKQRRPFSGTQSQTQQQQQQNQQWRRGQRQRYSGSSSSQQQQHQQSRGRRDVRQEDWDFMEARQRRQYQQQYYNYQRRQRQQQQGHQRQRARRHEDAIDVDDFYLTENDNPGKKGQIYDNGMQIFLMGFWEAGKTATQLAVDAAADAINPFSRGREDNEDGEWWYDEERGREVLDVDILDYSPRRVGQPERRRGPRRSRVDGTWEPDVSTQRRERRKRGGARHRRPIYRASTPQQRHYSYGSTGSSNGTDVEPTRRGRSNAFDTSHDNSSRMTDESAHDSTASTARRTSRRATDDEEASPRPIYGLYHNDDIGRNPNGEVEYNNGSHQDEQPDHYHQQQWKDRLRHKFDVALGLTSPPMPSPSTETYYDSWKTQMEEMDEGRKEALRRKQDRMNESPEAGGGVGGGGSNSKQSKTQQSSLPDTSPPSSFTSYPKKNRRARMRAAKSKVNLQTPPQPSQGTLHPSQGSSYRGRYPSNNRKSHLEEVPFWREGGTIASLLFDNLPSSSSMSGRTGGRRNGRRPRMKRGSLENIILSPFGHSHTVTSLFLYVARSSLTAFAILCRWAGVRGTIPQPIVVTTVFAILLSARRGQRVVSVALTVLGLRLVGEFIHGSLHGNEFWDDEYDFEEHGWKDGKML